jgi:hypothetical protein
MPDFAMDYQIWLLKRYEEYTELLTGPFNVASEEVYTIPETVIKYAKGANISGELNIFGKLEVV